MEADFRTMPKKAWPKDVQLPVCVSVCLFVYLSVCPSGGLVSAFLQTRIPTLLLYKMTSLCLSVKEGIK